MKKNLLYILFLIVVIIISPILKVKGQTYTESFNNRPNVIPSFYVDKKEPNGIINYEQLGTITKKSNGQYVYCLEVNSPLLPNAEYTGQDFNQAEIANITPEQWRRVQLLAYYGYGYKNGNIDHTNLKWYGITQYLIWQTVPHGWEIYFTDTLNGKKEERFIVEIKQMEDLIAKHSVVPNFEDTTFNMTVGKTLELTDQNKVLENYTIEENDYVSVQKDGNKLILKAKKVGNTTLTLIKKDTKYSAPPIVYVKDNYQDVVEVGSYDPVETKININITGGKITINKKDKDTGLSAPQGEATLQGAVYGIYTEDGSYVTQLITDEHGFAESEILPNLGRYYLQEITPSKGYELDLQKYYFDLTAENLYPNIEVKEKVIEREYTITKVIGSNKTQIMTPEVNIEFGIYNHLNELVLKLTTDNEGKITFTLPYGTYTLKQLSVEEGLEKMPDFKFTITESGPKVNKVFSDAYISARIKVIKVDENGNNIPISGIKFKIKDLNSGNYVCQTTSYPENKTYCEYATNEDGILITPYPLERGTYELEEVDQLIEGYLWNPTPLKFTINEKTKLEKEDGLDAVIVIKFPNKEVKGNIEIEKIGEKLDIKDGTFSYSEVPLPNIEFGLYDANDNLIDTFFTDKKGHILIEGLKLGKYYLKELKTLDGYLLDEKSYEINLEYQDEYTPVVTKTFTLKNYLPKGKLEFTKKDLATGEEIPNTKIEIYTDKDELIYTGLTDENGQIIIDNLFAGTFYLIEKEAPEGYLLNDEKIYFTILTNGEVIKTSMDDEKVDMPDTSNTELKGHVITGGMTLLGATLLLYVRKRKEK